MSMATVDVVETDPQKVFNEQFERWWNANIDYVDGNSFSEKMYIILRKYGSTSDKYSFRDRLWDRRQRYSFAKMPWEPGFSIFKHGRIACAFRELTGSY